MQRKARKSCLLARFVSTGLAILLLNIFPTMQLVQADAISQDRLEKQRRYLEMRERERAEKKQASQRKKANKEVQKRNCEHATKQLHEYKTASALYDYDKSGKRVYLNKADREKAEKQAAADVEKWCN